MKQKVLIFHPTVAPYRIDLFNFLSNKFDAKVCLFLRNLISQVFDYSKIEKQLEFSPMFIVKSELGTLKWVKSIWKELSSERYDLVLVNEFGIPTLLAFVHRFLKRKKYKIVTITDDSYSMIADDNHFTKRHKKALELMAPHIDEIITVEPKVTEWYRNNYGKGVYFPIICDDNKAIIRQNEVLSISKQYVEKYQLENKKVLLFVGRLVRIKNVQFAIDSFIKADIPNSVFVIVGSGDEYEILTKKYAERENVKIVGRFESDELYAWYNVASVFTLPSIQEPFGAVTNEALVAGCKVLISKYAGSNCLVKPGINGYVIDPYDEEDYISKLRLLMNDTDAIKKVAVKQNMMTETFATFSNNLFEKLCNII